MTAGGERRAVVVAATDAGPGVAGRVRRFADEVAGRGEVVLVDGSREGVDAATVPGVRVLRRPAGTLAPELWREGWRATDAPLVALSTASMSPEPGWLDALTARMSQTGAAAVGGPIAPAEDLSATDRAVYLLRYVAYMPPVPGPLAAGPPGENALYRRERLKGHDDLIARGFWEAEVHRNLRRRGETLAMADGAAVRFHGGGSLAAWVGRRFRHGRHYGRARGGSMAAVERLVRAAAAPGVPAVMAWRIVAALWSRGALRTTWVPAVPRLAPLLVAWAAGEGCGLLSGDPVRRGGRARAGRGRAGRRRVAQGQGDGA